MKKSILLFFSAVLIFVSISTPVFASSSDSGSSNPFQFIIDLFVPREDYFSDNITTLNNRVNAKLGGVGYLFQTINNFFATLKTAPDTSSITFNLPDNFISSGQPGQSYDMFKMSKPFISILRGATTCFFILITAIACYKKLVVLFEK